MSLIPIEINVRDFRAIESASIKIAGISVLTGPNGSGKSTVAKALYLSFFVLKNYERLMADRYLASLRGVEGILYNMIHELRDRNIFIHRAIGRNRELLNREDIEKSARRDVSLFADVIEELKTSEAVDPQEMNRLMQLVKSALNLHEQVDLDGAFVAIKAYISGLCNQICQQIEERNSEVLDHLFERTFDQACSSNVVVSEYGVPIKTNGNSLLDVQSVKECFYIDTPFCLDFVKKDHDKDHWDEINQKILQENPDRTDWGKDDLFSSVLGGRLELDPAYPRLIQFKSELGPVYDLNECAMGIKSMALLNMLYNQGYLNKDTLVIIDEPEIHLHPQWIVEYARIIVLLNKKLGVKFVLASHNPDMISALKYISEKEQVADDVYFYLADKGNATDTQYRFKELGRDIEPIFASFNIALDRIAQYGT